MPLRLGARRVSIAREIHALVGQLQIAEETNATAAQVALAWVIAQPAVIAPIVGARTLQQFESNLVGADLTLDDSAIARLTEVSAPVTNDYPYGPFGERMRRRYVDSSARVVLELFG